VPNGRVGMRQVEATFGGHFLAPFGYEGRLVRSNLGGDVNHLIAGGQLEVGDGGDLREDGTHIGVLDVPAVLAKVEGDAIGTFRLSDHRRRCRVGLIGATGPADSGYMVNVDIQS